MSEQKLVNTERKKKDKKSLKIGKSSNQNIRVKEDKENLTTEDNKHQKQSTVKAPIGVINPKVEPDGGCMISNILPDINWYPDPSKHVKSNFTRDLVSQYPLTYKMMDFILKNDFELPKLNTVQRRSLFRYPSSEEKDFILEICPNFKSGRFNEEEKLLITKRLRQFFCEIEFTDDDQKSLIQEMESFPLCHGGARGSTSHNLIYVRLYFACHVAGESFLRYRLAYDIYNTILSLWSTEFDPMIKPANIKTENTPDSKNDHSKNDEEVKGRFQTKDSCELIRCVTTQLHSKGLPIEVDEINLRDIDWKAIQEKTFRTPRSMQKHFTLVVWPLLKDGPSVADEEKTWQRDLLRMLVEKKTVYIQDVDWKELQKCHFPNNTTIQLRTFISNIIKKRMQRMESGEKKVPIHTMLGSALERFSNLNKSNNADSSIIQRQNEITNCYEDLKNDLNHPSIGRTSTPKRDDTKPKFNQNNNPSKKRKANESLITKKKRKTKHTLFTEKSGNPSQTLN